jgi:heterotetrameric sarcosine oxidase gamma subunit
VSKPSLAMHFALATIAKLGHHGAPGKTGVTLTELTGLSLAAITLRGNQTAALSAAIERELGVPPPVRPGRTSHGTVAFVWSGCDQWLAIGASADNLVRRLSSCAGALGSVTDLTGARTLLRISGPRARDGLMKVVPIDLDESAFTTGSAAVTVAEHIPVQLWQIDASPSYEIACPRSYGVSLWKALTLSFAEYGYSSGSRMA